VESVVPSVSQEQTQFQNRKNIDIASKTQKWRPKTDPKKRNKPNLNRSLIFSPAHLSPVRLSRPQGRVDNFRRWRTIGKRLLDNAQYCGIVVHSKIRKIRKSLGREGRQLTFAAFLFGDLLYRSTYGKNAKDFG
jgi:hypothetical protein